MEQQPSTFWSSIRCLMNQRPLNSMLFWSRHFTDLFFLCVKAPFQMQRERSLHIDIFLALKYSHIHKKDEEDPACQQSLLHLTRSPRVPFGHPHGPYDCYDTTFCSVLQAFSNQNFVRSSLRAFCRGFPSGRGRMSILPRKGKFRIVWNLSAIYRRPDRWKADLSPDIRTAFPVQKLFSYACDPAGFHRSVFTVQSHLYSSRFVRLLPAEQER